MNNKWNFCEVHVDVIGASVLRTEHTVQAEGQMLWLLDMNVQMFRSFGAVSHARHHTIHISASWSSPVPHTS